MDIILCDELLQEIFHRLPAESSAAVSLVSRRWLRLLRSSLTSLHLHLPPSPSFLSDHTSLSSLHLSPAAATAAATADILPSVAAACPRLSALSLAFSRPQISLQFLSLFPNLKTLTLILINHATIRPHSPDHSSTVEIRLQSLTVSGIRAGDYGISWLWRNLSSKTLTRLVLEDSESVGDNSSFTRFIEASHNLHELQLKTCRSIVSFILKRLNSNSLRSLTIYDGGSNDGLLRFLRQTHCDLRTLDLRLPLDLNDTHLIEIGAKFQGITSLCLQSCCLVTAEGLKSLGLALGENLKALSLINLIKRESGFLVELAQNLKKIEKLNLSYSYLLVDKEFVSMIGSCGGLRDLKLRGCSRLTIASMISLCKSCRSLENLDVLYCDRIEAEGIEFVILNLPQLRQLRVEDSKLSELARRWMTSKFIQVLAQ